MTPRLAGEGPLTKQAAIRSSQEAIKRQSRGEKGERNEMRGYTKPKMNDSTVARGCLLCGKIHFDVMMIQQHTIQRIDRFVGCLLRHEK